MVARISPALHAGNGHERLLGSRLESVCQPVDPLALLFGRPFAVGVGMPARLAKMMAFIGGSPGQLQNASLLSRQAAVGSRAGLSRERVVLRPPSVIMCGLDSGGDAVMMPVVERIAECLGQRCGPGRK